MVFVFVWIKHSTFSHLEIFVQLQDSLLLCAFVLLLMFFIRIIFSPFEYHVHIHSSFPGVWLWTRLHRIWRSHRLSVSPYTSAHSVQFLFRLYSGLRAVWHDGTRSAICLNKESKICIFFILPFPSTEWSYAFCINTFLMSFVYVKRSFCNWRLSAAMNGPVRPSSSLNKTKCRSGQLCSTEERLLPQFHRQISADLKLLIVKLILTSYFEAFSQSR